MDQNRKNQPRNPRRVSRSSILRAQLEREELAAFRETLPMEMLKLLADANDVGINPGFNVVVTMVDGVLTLVGKRTVYDTDGSRSYTDDAELRMDTDNPMDLETMQDLVNSERRVRAEAARQAAARADAVVKLNALDLTAEQRKMLGLDRL